MTAQTLLEVKNVIENTDIFRNGKIEFTADCVTPDATGSYYEISVTMTENKNRFDYLRFAGKFDVFNDYGTLAYLRKNLKGEIELVIF